MNGRGTDLIIGRETETKYILSPELAVGEGTILFGLEVAIVV
jgi:hypothetical protein